VTVPGYDSYSPMSSRLRFAIDALALLVSKAAFIGLRLAALYLVARRADAATFGAIALGMTIAEISRVVADWGCDTLSLRKFSHPDRARAAAAFGWVVRLRVAASLVAMTLAAVVAAFVVTLPSVTLLLMISATAATSLWLNLGVNWLQARALLRPTSVALTGIGALSLAAQLVIVAQGWSIEFQFGALLLGEALIVVLVLRLARRSMRGVAAYGEPVTLGTWFAEATPIAWAALIATAYTRFDQFYIAHFAGGETLGNYTLAARVLEPCAFVAAAFASTIYARTSGIIMGKYDIASAHGIALRSLNGGLVLGLSMMLMVLLFSLYPMQHWLPTFSGAVPLERIGSVMIIFRCINLSLTALIQAAGAYVAILRLTRFNLVLVPVLVVCGDRLAGVIGVAVGVALAEGINSAIQLRMFQGLYPRSVRQGVSV